MHSHLRPMTAHNTFATGCSIKATSARVYCTVASKRITWRGLALVEAFGGRPRFAGQPVIFRTSMENPAR